MVGRTHTTLGGNAMMMSAEDDKPTMERMIPTDEVAELLGVSSRMVLNLPIKQFRLGPRTIRFRLADVYDYLGIENPNS
jgi:predicted DNA-binding transcriptional regulator AlpA